eukprot:g42067.t1
MMGGLRYYAITNRIEDREFLVVVPPSRPIALSLTSAAASDPINRFYKNTIAGYSVCSKARYAPVNSLQIGFCVFRRRWQVQLRFSALKSRIRVIVGVVVDPHEARLQAGLWAPIVAGRQRAKCDALLLFFLPSSMYRLIQSSRCVQSPRCRPVNRWHWKPLGRGDLSGPSIVDEVATQQTDRMP